MLEEYERLKLRYESLSEAAEKNQAEIGRLMAENSALKSTVIRLGGEAQAAQRNAQLLGDDYNERSKQFGVEIAELRSRLRAVGLSAEVN